jgi:hypothetical protein
MPKSRTLRAFSNVLQPIVRRLESVVVISFALIFISAGCASRSASNVRNSESSASPWGYTAAYHKYVTVQIVSTPSGAEVTHPSVLVNGASAPTNLHAGVTPYVHRMKNGWKDAAHFNRTQDRSCSGKLRISKVGFRPEIVQFNVCVADSREQADENPLLITVALDPLPSHAPDSYTGGGMPSVSGVSGDDKSSEYNSPDSISSPSETQSQQQRPMNVSCIFTPHQMYLACDGEAATDLAVEASSELRPVPRADLIIEGGHCAPLTRREDVIRGTTDSRGIFKTTCTFSFGDRACDYYADGSPEHLRTAHVTATASGYGEAHAECSYVAQVPHR